MDQELAAGDSIVVRVQFTHVFDNFGEQSKSSRGLMP
jgi:hypothetical protein